LIRVEPDNGKKGLEEGAKVGRRLQENKPTNIVGGRENGGRRTAKVRIKNSLRC